MSASSDQSTRMLTALVRLRGALQDAQLPLELPGVEAHRAVRGRVIDQLEDYAIPRQMSVDAPMLVVVGGSTGAGKSTLVNSLVGRRVTASGLLRPTTRSPVLVHHPDDVQWFRQERLLPDLVRVDHGTDDPHALQLVASDTVPEGIAILDAPDVDSVEEHNRDLAAQLLAAADLWLFVTSAARYSDQVPWQHLRQAAERAAAVADRAGPHPGRRGADRRGPPRPDAREPGAQGLPAVHRERGDRLRGRLAAARGGGGDPRVAHLAGRRRRRAAGRGAADARRQRADAGPPLARHRRRRRGAARGGRRAA